MNDILKHKALLRKRKKKQVHHLPISIEKWIHLPCTAVMLWQTMAFQVEERQDSWKSSALLQIAFLKAHSPLSCTCIMHRIFCNHEYRKLLPGKPWYREGLEEQRCHFSSSVYWEPQAAQLSWNAVLRKPSCSLLSQEQSLHESPKFASVGHLIYTHLSNLIFCLCCFSLAMSPIQILDEKNNRSQ